MKTRLGALIVAVGHAVGMRNGSDRARAGS